jgi:hypothetical protein
MNMSDDNIDTVAIAIRALEASGSQREADLVRAITKSAAPAPAAPAPAAPAAPVQAAEQAPGLTKEQLDSMSVAELNACDQSLIDDALRRGV